MEGKSNKKIIIAIIAAVAVIAAVIIIFLAIGNNNKEEGGKPIDTSGETLGETSGKVSVNAQFDISVAGDRIIGGSFEGAKLKATTVQEIADMGWTPNIGIDEKQEVDVSEEEAGKGLNSECRLMSFIKNGTAFQIETVVVDGEDLRNCEVRKLMIPEGYTLETEIAGQRIVLGQTKVNDLIADGWKNKKADFDKTEYDEDTCNPITLVYGDAKTNFLVNGNDGDIYSDCVITGVSIF